MITEKDNVIQSYKDKDKTQTRYPNSPYKPILTPITNSRNTISNTKQSFSTPKKDQVAELAGIVDSGNQTGFESENINSVSLIPQKPLDITQKSPRKLAQSHQISNQEDQVTKLVEIVVPGNQTGNSASSPGSEKPKESFTTPQKQVSQLSNQTGKSFTVTLPEGERPQNSPIAWSRPGPIQETREPSKKPSNIPRRKKNKIDNNIQSEKPPLPPPAPAPPDNDPSKAGFYLKYIPLIK